MQIPKITAGKHIFKMKIFLTPYCCSNYDVPILFWEWRFGSPNWLEMFYCYFFWFLIIECDWRRDSTGNARQPQFTMVCFRMSCETSSKSLRFGSQNRLEMFYRLKIVIFESKMRLAKGFFFKRLGWKRSPTSVHDCALRTFRGMSSKF